MKLPLLVIALGLLIPITTKAQSDTRTVAEKIKLVEDNILPGLRLVGDAPINIKDRMAFYKIKGATIAVIYNYKIEWAKAYGWADDSLQTPVTTKTLFQAGSVSKSLNAVGVLRLVQDKKIDLNADINNYLTTWEFSYDSLSKNKKITIANLLSHTAGLNLHGFGGYEKGKPLPTIVQVLNGEKPANSPAVKSMYQPGLRYEYSGGGITISQLVVMDIAHQPYDKYMYNSVLKPLGMTASSYTQPPVDTQGLLATGYNNRGNKVKGNYHIYPEQAAAGLWTNPTDLAKYVIDIQLSLQGKSNKVLNQQTTKLMLTPYIDRSAALGVFIDDFNGEKYFQHSGSDVGFMTQYYGSLEGGNGVVVMVNSDNGMIMDEIINSVANVYQFRGLDRSKSKQIVKVPADILKTYIGKYELGPKTVLTITIEGNQLYGQPAGGPKMPLFPEAQNRFFVKGAPIEIEFIKDNAGAVTKAVAYEGGNAHEAKKIE